MGNLPTGSNSIICNESNGLLETKGYKLVVILDINHYKSDTGNPVVK